MTVKKFQTGFTLVELLVVLAILAVLATLGIASFRSSQMKGRDSRRKAELRQLGAAFELYYNDKGEYPDDDGAGKVQACAPDGATLCSWGDQFSDENDTIYMTQLPVDPIASHTYYYAVGANNASFQLYARLENTLDPDVPKSGGTPQNYGISCGAKSCNYGVASTDTTPAAGRTLVNE